MNYYYEYSFHELDETTKRGLIKYILELQEALNEKIVECNVLSKQVAYLETSPYIQWEQYNNYIVEVKVQEKRRYDETKKYKSVEQ